MKRIFILTFLTLCLFGLFTSRADAQKSGAVNVPAKPQEYTLPSNIKTLRDLAANGTPPNMLATGGGSIYNVNALNGSTSNSSSPKYLNIGMDFIGITLAGDNLYGLTSASLTNGYRSYLFVIGPEYGANRYSTLSYGTPLYLNHNRMYCLTEADLAYDRSGNSGGLLYATCMDGGAWKLITIQPNSGDVKVKGLLPSNSIFSALAFNLAGDLYTLNTHSRTLFKLDKNNANVLETIPLTGTLPNTSSYGGMGFSDTGMLYAAFGGALISINLTNGAVTNISSAGYFSGLVVWGGSSGPAKVKTKVTVKPQ